MYLFGIKTRLFTGYFVNWAPPHFSAKKKTVKQSIATAVPGNTVDKKGRDWLLGSWKKYAVLILWYYWESLLLNIVKMSNPAKTVHTSIVWRRAGKSCQRYFVLTWIRKKCIGIENFPMERSSLLLQFYHDHWHSAPKVFCLPHYYRKDVIPPTGFIFNLR